MSLSFRRLPIVWPRARDLLHFAARRLKEEHLPQVAASLTFTTVLALVPLLTIALSIFTAFPVFDTFRASLDDYFVQNLMPRGIANTILDNLNQFAAASMRLSAVGGAVLVVTAVAMMSMIDQVFNRIWRVRTRRPLVLRVLVYWAILTLGPLLIGISIKVTSYLFTATTDVARYVPLSGGVFYTVLSVGLTTLAFTLLYVSVPNRLVDWRDALWGGLLAGVAFECAKRLFALYVAGLPTYTMVYGAIAAIPIFLLWVYMFWIITLVGALLTAALPVVRHERWWHVESPGSAFIDAMAVMRVLVEAHGSSPSSTVDGRMIRLRTRLGFDESEALLNRMLEAGWVARIKSDVPRHTRWSRSTGHAREKWVLIANPQRLRLADVYRLFVFTAHSYTPLALQVEEVIEQGLTEPVAAFFSRQPEVRTIPGPSASAGTSASWR